MKKVEPEHLTEYFNSDKALHLCPILDCNWVGRVSESEFRDHLNSHKRKKEPDEH